MSDRSSPRSWSLLTQNDWNEAVADGTLSLDDVIERLTRIAAFEFSEEDFGYDEDGFLVSLTAAGIAREGGVKLQVYPNDHPPPHVHIKRRGKEDIRINLATGEVVGTLPAGVRAKQLKNFRALVSDSFPLLAGMWQDYQGVAVARANDY